MSLYPVQTVIPESGVTVVKAKCPKGHGKEVTIAAGSNTTCGQKGCEEVLVPEAEHDESGKIVRRFGKPVKGKAEKKGRAKAKAKKAAPAKKVPPKRKAA